MRLTRTHGRIRHTDSFHRGRRRIAASVPEESLGFGRFPRRDVRVRRSLPAVHPSRADRLFGARSPDARNEWFRPPQAPVGHWFPNSYGHSDCSRRRRCPPAIPASRRRRVPHQAFRRQCPARRRKDRSGPGQAASGLRRSTTGSSVLTGPAASTLVAGSTVAEGTVEVGTADPAGRVLERATSAGAFDGVLLTGILELARRAATR